MKYIVCIVLFSSFYFYNEVKIAPLLEPHIASFVLEAQKRGINGMELVMQLDSIYIDHLPYPDLERTYKNKIVISPYVLQDTLITRCVVYHAMGHIMGKMHDDSNPLAIMTSAKPNGFSYAIYANDSIWQEQVTLLFKKEDDKSALSQNH